MRQVIFSPRFTQRLLPGAILAKCANSREQHEYMYTMHEYLYTVNEYLYTVRGYLYIVHST